MNNISIDNDLCKKCNICVEFCPKQVFNVNKDGYIIPEYASKCIGCKLCVSRCPDFALTVEVDR